MSNLILSTKRLYKNAGKAVAWWQIQAVAINEGQAELRISYAKSEDGAVVNKSSPVSMKNVGKANQTTPAGQAVAEAEARWKKQLDKGYVENIEDASQPVTNALGLVRPMLAKPMDDVKMDEVDWATAYLQPKLDGHRCMKDGIIYSRGGKEHNVEHIIEALNALPAFKDLKTDGELYIHGDYSLQQLGSLIKKPQEDSLKLEYWMYDTVSDAPFANRYMNLQHAFLASSGDTPDVRLKLTPTIPVRSLEEAMSLHHQNVANGYEGSILRWGEEGYIDNKRSKYLIKIKDFTDAEYPVIGYELGTPSRIGGELLQVPIFVYEVKPGLTGKVTAMGNAHEKHAEYLELLSGKNTDRRMLTIEHFGFTDDGVPNIATAKCWRDEL